MDETARCAVAIATAFVTSYADYTRQDCHNTDDEVHRIDDAAIATGN